MDEKKLDILRLLQNGHDMFTAEIANTLGLSPPTASKYLQILKAEGKVKSYERTPYIYWKRAKAHGRRY